MDVENSFRTRNPIKTTRFSPNQYLLYNSLCFANFPTKTNYVQFQQNFVCLGVYIFVLILAFQVNQFFNAYCLVQRFLTFWFAPPFCYLDETRAPPCKYYDWKKALPSRNPYKRLKKGPYSHKMLKGSKFIQQK